MTGNVEFSIFYRFSSEINDSELGARDKFSHDVWSHDVAHKVTHSIFFGRIGREYLPAKILNQIKPMPMAIFQIREKNRKKIQPQSSKEV